MHSIHDLLIKTILERLLSAGFEVPEDMTEKQRQEFVFSALENAVILPADDHERLIAAAHAVVQHWENSGLAEAVRELGCRACGMRFGAGNKPPRPLTPPFRFI